METAAPPELTLALPAYNESPNIVAVLDGCVDALNRLGRTWEIIVIDNHSSDDTARRVREYMAAHQDVRLVVHEKNRMYSGSCRTAMQEARGQWIAIMDSDGQMDPQDLQRMLDQLERGADLVFGWRRRRHDPFPRLAISMCFNTLGKWRLAFPLHDLNCGMRMFTRKFCVHAPIHHVINMVNPELFVRARQGNFRVEEVEVRHMARKAGKTSHNLTRLWRIFMDVNRYFSALQREMKHPAAS